jgi:hypothetical protein
MQSCLAMVDICGVTKVNGTFQKIVTQPAFSFFHQQSSLYTVAPRHLPELLITQTPEGYISKDIYPLIYILKSPKKDISYHFLEKDILGI